MECLMGVAPKYEVQDIVGHQHGGQNIKRQVCIDFLYPTPHLCTPTKYKYIVMVHRCGAKNSKSMLPSTHLPFNILSTILVCHNILPQINSKFYLYLKHYLRRK